MKNLSIFLVSLLFISCSRDSKYLEVLQKKLNISDTEIKGYQLYVSEISDREYTEIKIEYFDKQYQKTGLELSLDNKGKYLDSLKISEGNKAYKEVLYFKLKNSDTISKGHMYFNDSDKLIDINRIK